MCSARAKDIRMTKSFFFSFETDWDVWRECKRGKGEGFVPFLREREK